MNEPNDIHDEGQRQREMDREIDALAQDLQTLHEINPLGTRALAARFASDLLALQGATATIDPCELATTAVQIAVELRKALDEVTE